MSRYTVESVVCDYGLYEDGELKLICSSSHNAYLIKAIMEKDDKYQSGFNGSPKFERYDKNVHFFTREEAEAALEKMKGEEHE